MCALQKRSTWNLVPFLHSSYWWIFTIRVDPMLNWVVSRLKWWPNDILECLVSDGRVSRD
ncbi:hypothetical protein MtrunA17_Chr3g0146081 [Medicago truncatula]|uniref:Uncharacterized protein n=1 Tax=Medicago truncatula TaxID=3880 RepID=A0A396J453_MEDTR|nr:hypothetical protein MtrunA17_Chr3g0146081 [Medicago truncatula]